MPAFSISINLRKDTYSVCYKREDATHKAHNAEYETEYGVLLKETEIATRDEREYHGHYGKGDADIGEEAERQRKKGRRKGYNRPDKSTRLYREGELIILLGLIIFNHLSFLKLFIHVI